LIEDFVFVWFFKDVGVVGWVLNQCMVQNSTRYIITIFYLQPPLNLVI